MKHFRDVAKQLTHNDMNKFFTKLGGLSPEDIEKARKGDDTEVNNEEEARKILIHWRKSRGKAANLQAIFQALDDLDYNKPKEAWKTKWTEEKRKGELDKNVSTVKIIYCICPLVCPIVWH